MKPSQEKKTSIMVKSRNDLLSSKVNAEEFEKSRNLSHFFSLPGQQRTTAYDGVSSSIWKSPSKRQMKRGFTMRAVSDLPSLRSGGWNLTQPTKRGAVRAKGGIKIFIHRPATGCFSTPCSTPRANPSPGPHHDQVTP